MIISVKRLVVQMDSVYYVHRPANRVTILGSTAQGGTTIVRLYGYVPPSRIPF